MATMAVVNVANREIVAKVVYFGAAKAGCNTNLGQLHERVEAREKSALHRFGPEVSPERTLFFEYVPAIGPVFTGFSLVVRVYSLPGGLDHPAHRREVLHGVDALVFVCDARRERGQVNLDAMIALERWLAEQGQRLAAMPTVLQANHTDAATARSLEDLAFDLNPYGFPVVASAARSGDGVLDTHAAIRGALLARIRDALAGQPSGVALTPVHRTARERDVDVVARHQAAIRRADRRERATDAPRPGSSPPEGTPRVEQVELPFQPAGFRGTRPIRVLEARVAGERILLDVVMDPADGSLPRRLSVALLNRPFDAVPPPVPPPIDPARLGASASLPDRIALPAPAPSDLPPIWYGVAGLTGGALVGFLVAFLVFG